MTSQDFREPSMANDPTEALTRAAPVKVASVASLLGDRYDDRMRLAFPDVEPPYGVPFGYLALLQLRMPRSVSRGGIIIPDSEKDVEKMRCQAALVRAVGRMAFHNRSTGKPWVEGPWFQAGDFIRCPMYGGDRFSVEFEPPGGGPKDTVLFVFIRDEDAIAPVTADPLSVTTS